MTIKLYNKDVKQVEFQAKVISVSQDSKTGFFDVILDQTAFFPEEGGQGSDDGTLDGIPVLHVSIDKSNTITHTLKSSFEIGQTITGHVDYTKRFDYMQQHSGEHIFSGLVCTAFGYHNVGFHLGTDITTLDFDGVLTMEQMEAIEKKANEIIYQNLPVIISYPDKKTLQNMDYRSKIALDGEVRIVEIPGVDVCACCAPHVDYTGQIGLFKVIDMQAHKGGVRLTILCGMRALNHFSFLCKTTDSLSASLSSKTELLCDSVKRLFEDSAKKQERINNLQAQLLTLHIKQLPSPVEAKNVVLFEDSMDTKAVRDAVNLMTASYEGFCAIFTGDEATGYRFIIGSSQLDCKELGNQLSQQTAAKCGGSSRMIQGSVAASKDDLTSLVMQNNL